MDRDLGKLYYSPRTGYSSLQKLYLATKGKYSKQQVREWLLGQDTYTLHRPARKTYPRKQYYASTYNETWQMDLADMQAIAKWNRGFRYILCCIDIFSRVAQCIPVKNKTGPVVAKAIAQMFRTSSPPQYCQTDRGTEFYNAHVRRVFAKYGVQHYSVHSEMKAALVERFIRTIKEKLYKYFTAKQTYRYIDVLPRFVHAYNHTVHRSIGMAPAQVNEDTLLQVWYKLYGSRRRTSMPAPSLHSGDYVRISKYKHKLEKGYLPKWTRELFRVAKVIRSSPVTYELVDWDGQSVQGKFYSEELEKVYPAKTFLIEKVIRRQGNRLYVKWLGYPSSMNSWIKRSDVARASQSTE